VDNLSGSLHVTQPLIIASMRPRRYAVDNIEFAGGGDSGGVASMRPRRYAVDNQQLPRLKSQMQDASMRPRRYAVDNIALGSMMPQTRIKLQ